MVKLINKLKNKKGFTLIELIVVLAVLAIILAIAVPRFIGVQNQSKIDADNATLALIAKTVDLYKEQGLTVDEIKGKLPGDFPGFDLQSVPGKQDISNIEIDISGDMAIVTYGENLSSANAVNNSGE